MCALLLNILLNLLYTYCIGAVIAFVIVHVAMWYEYGLNVTLFRIMAIIVVTIGWPYFAGIIINNLGCHTVLSVYVAGIATPYLAEYIRSIVLEKSSDVFSDL